MVTEWEKVQDDGKEAELTDNIRKLVQLVDSGVSQTRTFATRAFLLPLLLLLFFFIFVFYYYSYIIIVLALLLLFLESSRKLHRHPKMNTRYRVYTHGGGNIDLG